MKLFSFIVFASVLLSTRAIAGSGDSSEFTLGIKSFNLAKLWRSDSLQVLQNDLYSAGKFMYYGTQTEKFPEPYGFIGLDYERFYIHYLAVVKDTGKIHRYLVAGKTKMKDTTCNFKGTITVSRARTSKTTTTLIMPTPENKKNEVPYRQGVIYCDVSLWQDSAKPNTGTITGRLTTKFFLDSSQHLFYDNLDNVSDSHCNNQFIGLWKAYKTNVVKKCNWGDYRIPNCGDLDEGAGGFSPSDKYIQNGWQNYRDAYSTGTLTQKSARALAVENFRWWR